jgi:hypothetical protein
MSMYCITKIKSNAQAHIINVLIQTRNPELVFLTVFGGINLAYHSGKPPGNRNSSVTCSITDTASRIDNVEKETAMVYYFKES